MEDDIEKDRTKEVHINAKPPDGIQDAHDDEGRDDDDSEDEIEEKDDDDEDDDEEEDNEDSEDDAKEDGDEMLQVILDKGDCIYHMASSNY
jgi:hypothetical protein